MTEQERKNLEYRLTIYERQRLKLENTIRQYENIAEELQSQHEQNPSDDEVIQELEKTIFINQAKIAEHRKTLQIIDGIKWLLES